MKEVWGKRRSPRSRGKIKGEIPLKEPIPYPQVPPFLKGAREILIPLF